MVFEENPTHFIPGYITCCISESTEGHIGEDGIVEIIEVILL